MPRDLPLILQDHEVRALLDGRKTQHRFPITSMRVARTPETRPYTLRGEYLVKALDQADGFRCVHEDVWTWTASAFEHQQPATRTMWLAHLGYSAGQRLWVRECWSDQDCCKGEAMYRATACRDGLLLDEKAETHWRSSTHMPRWANRITLVVEGVKFERLQAISDEDVEAEGACNGLHDWDCRHPYFPDPAGYCVSGCGSWSYQEVFQRLWGCRHGAKPGQRWEDNPHVIALTFRVHRANIDKLEVAHAS